MRDGRYLPIISSNGSKLNISKKARRGKVSVPAPAVIPALLAYIEVDAVKKLVVGVVRVFLGRKYWSSSNVRLEPTRFIGL